MDIADKVRKLLTLAGNAGTEGEANAAYAAAQKLMIEHAISASDVAEPAEMVHEDIYQAEGAYMPDWLASLAGVLCEANRAHVIVEARQSVGGGYHPDRFLTIYGSRAAIADIRAMFDHIRNQIDRRAGECREAVGKAGKRAFRLGAVDRIGGRLKDAARQAEAEAAARAAALPEGPAREVAERGLALYKGQIARAREHQIALYALRGWTTHSRSSGGVRDDGAYRAGQRAADSMSFTARKALGAGK